MVWAQRGDLLLLELSSWSYARKHVGPLCLELSEWNPGDIAMADGSRPGHPTHSGKSILQPAAVNLAQWWCGSLSAAPEQKCIE